MKIGITNALLNSQKGFALILTLMVLAIITAMVIEFVYGVYIGTSSLNNWYYSQKLSVLANSGMGMGKEFISDKLAKDKYTYPGVYDMTLPYASQDFNAVINIRIEDENSKFNVNKIRDPIGSINENAYSAFRRLLSNLSLDANIADYVADWIDPDSEERVRGSEIGAKNGYLYSIDELLLVKGIDSSVYEKLSPYVTVHGNGLININTAKKPVIMTLSDDITEALAQRILDFRDNVPFEEKSQLQKVGGLELKIYGHINALITTKAEHFSVKISASGDGIKSVIESVISAGGKIKYWKEW